MGAPVCLDLTRLLSRVGREGLTGIDRVELAYLDWALARGDSRFLVRTSRGHLLLAEDGARALRAVLLGDRDLPRPDMLSRLTGRGGNPRHGAEALLRRFARRSVPRGMEASLAGLVRGHVYLNVGHSNLRRDTLDAVAKAAPVWVFLHDTIPLDLPDMNRPDMVDRFQKMLAATARAATALIVNSNHTAARVRHHWPGSRPPLPILVAPLGVEPARPQPEPASRPPSFVAVGTLEARKNHALLLDIWELLAKDSLVADLPHLHLVGVRGWRNEAFFDRLDRSALNGRIVHEHGPLPDRERNALVAGARALLFPSFAEGFGLPPVEAAAMGVLPICSDLPVLREMLGDAAVYLPPDDPYPWLETIRQCLDGRLGAERTGDFVPPTWTEHFRQVEDALKKTEHGRASGG